VLAYASRNSILRGRYGWGGEMAKTAVTVLQDQIEAIRREAYAAGYAAAMRSIRDFATKPPASAVQTTRPRGAAKAPEQATKRRGRPPSTARPTTPRRVRRGNNAQLIAEVLKALPAGTARPAEIRKALQNDKGVAIAFTSIRHALGQLATRHEVEPSADGKTWRYAGSGAGGWVLCNPG